MNLLPPDTIDNDVVTAIDFQALYRREKRKAALQRRRNHAAAAGAAAETDNNTQSAASLVQELSSVAIVPGDNGERHERCSYCAPWNCMPRNDSLSESPKTLEALSLQCLTQRDNNSVSQSAAVPSNDIENDNAVSKGGTSIGCITLFRDVYYQESVLNPALHDALYEWLQQLPINTTGRNENKVINGHWTTLPHARRRVAVFDGVWLAQQQQQTLHEHVTMDNSGVWFPPPLQLVVDWIVKSQVVPMALKRHLVAVSNATMNCELPLKRDVHYPNHMLVNHYPDATMGILPHTDGPAYAPWTITLSLGRGCNVLLNFSHRETQTGHNSHVSMILHGGGSMVLFCCEAYTHYLHSIAECSANGNAHFAAATAHQEDKDVVTECTSETCLNAPSGTAVHRRDDRISITIRHKLRE
jgi:2OG-Fe(II) oxygenase superfamily